MEAKKSKRKTHSDKDGERDKGYRCNCTERDGEHRVTRWAKGGGACLRGARAARAPRGANENERGHKRETAATVRHEREQGDEERESERTKRRPP